MFSTCFSKVNRCTSVKRSATIHKLLQVGGAICIAHLLQSLSGVVMEKFFGIICRPIICS